MSLHQTKVVDWLAIEKGTGDILLTLVDEEDWSDEQEHLRLLQDKLNVYIAFIESGEVYERLANDVGRPVSAPVTVRIQIVAKFGLPPNGEDFLRHAEATFAEAGVPLFHRVLRIPD